MPSLFPFHYFHHHLLLVVVDDDVVDDDDNVSFYIDSLQIHSLLFLQSQPDKWLSSSTPSKSKSIKSPSILLSRRDRNYKNTPVQLKRILSNDDEYLNRGPSI